MADLDPNYVIGRGRLYFDRFLEGTRTPTGELYFGNSPAFSLNVESEDLEHFSSEGGLKEQDESVTLSQTTSGQFDVDNISAENLALFFAGDVENMSAEAVVGSTQDAVLKRGHYYQLGETPTRPFGRRDVTAVTVTAKSGFGKRATGTVTYSGQPSADDTLSIGGTAITYKTSGATGNQVNIGLSAAATIAATAAFINANSGTFGVTATYTDTVLTLKAVVGGTGGNAISLAKTGTAMAVSAANLAGGSQTIGASGNWEVDLGMGRVQILHDAVDVEDGDEATFTFSADAITSEVVISKNQSIYGRLRFISNNPVGRNRVVYSPYCKITANGDYNLKGDDWQVMSFSLSILKLNSTTERVYIETLPPGT